MEASTSISGMEGAPKTDRCKKWAQGVAHWHENCYVTNIWGSIYVQLSPWVIGLLISHDGGVASTRRSIRDWVRDEH